MLASDQALLTGILIGFAALLGLLVGSFLNVVIYRVPLGKSIVSPPSSCPSCGERIRGWDNIPVLSWVLLRGKCRTCGLPISARYPLIEASSAVLFGFVGARFLAPIAEAGVDAAFVASTAIVGVAFLHFAAISIALAAIDLDTHRLPNVLTLPSYIVAIVLFAIAALLSGDWSGLLRSVIAGAALFAAYFAMAFAYPQGMGLGDVKLAGLIGVYLGWLGWGSVIVGAFGAFVLGGAFSVFLIATRRAGRKSGIPFGPWMLAGAFVGVFFGEHLWTGYLGLVGLS